jgi:hypothetical protein
MFISLDNTFWDLYMMRNTFMDLNLVHNTFVDVDMVHNTFHVLRCITHYSSRYCLHNRGNGSTECSQCPMKVSGTKDD